MCGIDAVSSTKAAETGSVAVTETGIIAVVEIAQQRKLVVVEKAVDHKSRLMVAVVSTITGFACTEPAVFHTLFHRQVDHRLVLAVVNAGETGQIALRVMT